MIPLRKRFRRELRVRALLVLLPLFARLPLRLAVAIGAALGFLGWYLVPRERRLALEHLALAFPDSDPAFRRRAGRASFVNLGRAALELACADGYHHRLKRIVELSPGDAALLQEAHALGKGVVFVSCHVGNWELLARRIGLEGYPCGTVAREAQDPRLTALLDRSRRAAGVRVLWRGSPGLAKELLRLLRQGGFVGLLIDQDTDVQGHFVPFFGRPAFTPRAAGDLAIRTGAPMLFGCVHRLAPSVHRVTIRKIEVERTGDREQDSRALTAAATLAIEREVRARPDEWVWMHRRWRTQEPVTTSVPATPSVE